MTRALICIGCPRGCHLEITGEGESLRVTGNACPRGESYARQEMTNPRRVVTAVVRTDSASLPWLPVKTAQPFPKARIPALLNRLYTLTVKAPVRLGQVVLPDAEGSGIDVIATESCDA